jgi:uncharacterized protein (DUF849 family)
MAAPATDKVVVTAALTGVLARRDQCPYIPYTPVEIAEEARRAHEQGAAVVHIHAREPESGGPTFDVGIYQQIKDEVQKRCPIIINFSTGGAGPMEERVGHLRACKPEIGALNMGSMNYAKYSEKKKAFVFDFVFQNPFNEIIQCLEAMRDGNVKPELECFDAGHIANHEPLVRMGLLKAPMQFSFILGVLGGIGATTENLAHMARSIPAGSTWEIIGISHVQWRLIAGALALGGNIRVGLEDNFYVDAAATQMAKSNGELVAKAVRMARDIGREPATPDEARKILSVGKAWG